MKDLIKALKIFAKYTDAKCPTKCEHDAFFVNTVKPDDVSSSDLYELEKLGFIPFEDFGFVSYRYGDN